jgi:redox-sensitive bicupin YhaK (pirin superfamily)
LLELAEPQSQYLTASEFQSVGRARVILGAYEGITSIVSAPENTIYLDVRLRQGERWTFVPPAGHEVAWLAVHSGRVNAAERVTAGELAVFQDSVQPIAFEALEDCGFVLGAAVKHPYELVTGYYSVHTNTDALRKGESNIASIGMRLHNQGQNRASR